MIERLTTTMGQIVVFEQSLKTLNLEDDKLDPEFNREGLHALKGKRPPPKKVLKDET